MARNFKELCAKMDPERSARVEKRVRKALKVMPLEGLKDTRELTPQLQAELDALAAMPNSEIDTTEMRPITDWSHAVRGPFYRPIKRPLSLRVDADIIDWFQRQGQGYQTRMNFALREYVERNRKPASSTSRK